MRRDLSALWELMEEDNHRQDFLDTPYTTYTQEQETPEPVR